MVVIREWYEARSIREQRMLLAMALVALPLLLYLLLVLPLSSAYQHALRTQLEAVDRNGRVKAMAKRLETGAAAPPAVADLNLFLIDNARASGLTVAADRGAEPALSSIKIDATSPSSVFTWIRQLEGQGYRIDSLRLTPAANAQVSAELIVRGGGR